MQQSLLSIYWHSTFSTLAPLLAALLDSGTCGPCRRLLPCQCAPSILRVPLKPTRLLSSQLSLIPNLRVTIVEPSALLNGTVFEVGPPIDPCHSGMCANGTVVQKARRILGPAICGLDFGENKRRDATGWPERASPTSRRALIIFRCSNAAHVFVDSQPGEGAHRRMCLNATSSGAFDALHAEFRRRNFVTRGVFMEDMPMCEQLVAVAAADVVIYSHGSAHTNFIALTPVTTVIELSPYLVSPVNATRDWCGRCAEPDSSRVWPTICGGWGVPAPALPLSRSQSRFIVKGLAATGLPAVQHIAVPAGKLPGGARVSDWGCLQPTRLAQLAVDAHDAMVNRVQLFTRRTAALATDR